MTEDVIEVKKIVLKDEIYSFLPHEKSHYKKELPNN